MPTLEERADEWRQNVNQTWAAAVGVGPIDPELSGLVGKGHTYRIMRDLVHYYRECSIKQRGRPSKEGSSSS
jgi:hypothetical protein